MQNLAKNSNLAKPLEMAISPAENRNWKIYKITNPDNESYIGRTSVFDARMSAYRTLGGKCHKQPLLYQSLLKYGLDGHNVSILETFDSTLDYAEGKEIFWIRSFMSNRTKWPEMNGLNKADGGQGALGMKIIGRPSAFKGRHHSEESKKKLSDYGKANPSMGMLGKKVSEEAKKKMSESKKGKPNLKLKGREQPCEFRLKNSANKIGKPNLKLRGRKMHPRLTPINTTNQKVLLFKEDGEFIRELKSKREASRVLGVGKGLVESLLKGSFGGKLNGFIIKNK